MPISRPVLALAALALVAAHAALAASPPKPVARPNGDKIEFTVPREVSPVKPMTGNDIRGRGEVFTRRETSVASEVPAGALPSADDVDRRTRLVLGLLERRAEMNRDELGGNSVSLDDPLTGEASDGLLGADDRFGRRDRDDDNSSRSDLPRDDRRDRERDRERDRSSGRDRDPDSSGNATTPAERELEKAQAAEDKPFLPTPDSISILGRDADRRGGSDNYLDPTRSGSRGSLSRGAEDAARSRTERMDTFRRLLGSPVSTPLAGGAVGGVDGRAGLLGGPAGPAGSIPGARNAGDAFGGRPGPGASPGVDSSFSAPTRPAELDLGLGRGGPRSIGTTVAPVTPSRPAETFPRQFDSRIPSRNF